MGQYLIGITLCSSDEIEWTRFRIKDVTSGTTYVASSDDLEDLEDSGTWVQKGKKGRDEDNFTESCIIKDIITRKRSSRNTFRYEVVWMEEFVLLVSYFLQMKPVSPFRFQWYTNWKSL